MKYIIVLLSYGLFCSIASAKSYQFEYELLKNYNACYILYSVNQNKIVQEYNPNDYCNQRISPDSTFKIPLSLMAFDHGTINNETRFKWNGKNGVMPEQNRDQSPVSWIRYSVVWVSQQITPQLGYTNIKNYLANFHYGNQNFDGDPGKHNGITHAWLGSSLKISAVEQLAFLKRMLGNQLPISKDAASNTINNLYLGKLDNGANYFGKTGSGRHGRNERMSNPSMLRDGWFVGFIQRDNQQYIFVSNLTDKKMLGAIDPADGSLKPYGSQILKPITLKLLNNYFLGSNP